MSQEPQSYQLHAPVESREEILFECVQLFFTNPLPSKTNLPVYHTITNPLVVKLMEGYVNHFSKWLDIPFFLPFFEKVLPVASLSDETGIIISAISTCGAVYLHKSDPSRYSHNSALTYLNSTIAMLKDELGKPDRRLHRCLIASILLNISEVNLDPTYSIQHISHLRGSMNILDEIKKTHSLYASTSDAAPFDSQITRYCFWPLVFSDLFFALMNSSVTRLNPIMWGRESGIDKIIPEKDITWYYCRIFYLLALVNNFVNHQNVPTLEDHKRKIDDVAHNKLIGKIQEWVLTLPRALKPVFFIEVTGDMIFPDIRCHGKQHHIMWIAFHAAHILLARRNTGLTDSNSIYNYHQQLGHACEIMGILKSCQDPAVWSCTLWAYCIAAPCLSSREERLEALSIFEDMNEGVGIGIRPELNNTPADI